MNIAYNMHLYINNFHRSVINSFIFNNAQGMTFLQLLIVVTQPKNLAECRVLGKLTEYLE